MSDSHRRADLPGDVPAEYAEAYRRGYERARAEAHSSVETQELPQQRAEPTPRVEYLPPAEPEPAQEPVDPFETARPSPPAEPPDETSFFSFTEEPPSSADDAWHADRHSERPSWVVPAILAALALLLLIAAYAVGRAFSDTVASSGTSGAGNLVMGGNVGQGSSQAANSPSSSSGRSPNGQNTGHGTAGHRQPYQGAVRAVSVGGATASCESPPAFDAAHRKVVYDPTAVYDGNLSTAWRCNGDGVGQTLTLELPRTTTLGEVGLIPGYAKTDPRSGADRYAENDRITKVRWDFGNGRSAIQTFDGSAHNRSLQTMRIPKVSTDQIVVHILASTPGPRHTVAVSEVRLAAPAAG
ncbi:MAG TPA: hypothetical protein VFJ19_21070 [Nocardioidaceae bacterium]|nr:hypothetical protein [Nocardioidaceae bacterium]